MTYHVVCCMDVVCNLVERKCSGTVQDVFSYLIILASFKKTNSEDRGLITFNATSVPCHVPLCTSANPPVKC
jgi:hypothetical protein